MRCQYCDKDNHNTADCRAISKFKQQKKAHFEAIAGPRKKSLAFLCLFKEINAIKRQLQLKPEKIATSKKRKAESMLSAEIHQSIQPLVVLKVKRICLLYLITLALAKPSLQNHLTQQTINELVAINKAHCHK
jgi:hypothetical protein